MKCGKAWAALAALFLFTACSMPSIKQVTDPKVFYKRDFRLNVNGIQGVGLIVVPRSQVYIINGESRGNLNLISVRSCHREWVAENLDSRKFNYTYAPVASLEAAEDCTVDLGGFDIKTGRHSWGMIVIEDPNGVFADAKCNGARLQGKTTACQAPAGLVQEINFEEDMLIVPQAGSCAEAALKDTPKRGKVFQYLMPAKECVLSFVTTKDAGARVHKHITLGYESVMLLEN